MTSDPTPVRRCVCKDKTFAELKAAGVRSVEEAATRFGVGTQCGSCRPYVARMAESGETAFPILPIPANPDAS